MINLFGANPESLILPCGATQGKLVNLVKSFKPLKSLKPFKSVNGKR